MAIGRWIDLAEQNIGHGASAFSPGYHAAQ